MIAFVVSSFLGIGKCSFALFIDGKFLPVLLYFAPICRYTIYKEIREDSI